MIIKEETALPTAEKEALLIGDAEEMTASEELEFVLKSLYDFKYNKVTGRISFKLKDDPEFKELNDYHLNSILRRVRTEDNKVTKNELIQLLHSDFTPTYDPFELYFKYLGKWDGETDHITEWANTVKTTNQKHWRKNFEKWIVALVGCLLDPKTVNHTAPVFCGAQGIGKTRWISKLVPDELKAYFFSGTINMSNKDSITQLADCMLIDMDEMENLSKSSIGDLKSLMTRENILIRRPYGRTTEKLQRRASFIGSINHKDFLKDESGSRRFLCFEVKEMNPNHTLDINLLYAQALHLYNNGFQFWFDAAEIAEVQEQNEQFHKTTFEEELLLNHFEPCTEETATNFLQTSALVKLLGVREKLHVSNATAQRVGKALTAKKFLRLKKNGRYVWAVKDKKIKKLRKVAPAA